MPATAPSRLPIPVSLEFFPPKTDEQRETLEKALPALKALNPEYV
ncbi:MAG: methylenetetrahydrofolate reductase [NAD(P)H], partial [Phenylobacterium zucineum]